MKVKCGRDIAVGTQLLGRHAAPQMAQGLLYTARFMTCHCHSTRPAMPEVSDANCFATYCHARHGRSRDSKIFCILIGCSSISFLF